MPGTNPHDHLASRAEVLWLKEPDPDPRSARYAAADKNRAYRDSPQPANARRPANWISALSGYEEFWRENGRTPRENTRDLATLPAEERRKGGWAGYQRKFEEKLCRYQIIRLDLSPAFEWDPQEHIWQKNFAAYRHHLELTGTPPYLNGADPAEFALARWFNRQLRQLQIGAQPKGRADQIAILLALRSTTGGSNHPC
ncbi:hypothetical protein GY21_15900 [Cryobacterium roopkundense]|uniref:Helicase-associated domain-containing protein n=1 Tax=Cryobacterium roopkundense TaxID=1001240 RepID=A0A099J2N5_9MICO|nr:hypothetical protein [Cryobacterium roopkundense]KGJ72340.1 hypothetical protein GY21_15900 [Cryobacterium roopkundense]MBB5640429.1 hypothetical protein [Cryobacterium roopkundense]